MSEQELFSVPAVESPRLRWVKRNGLKTKHYPDVAEGDEDDETGYDIHPWVAWRGDGEPAAGASNVCGGATEDDALEEYARRHGLRMWFEEDLHNERGNR